MYNDSLPGPARVGDASAGRRGLYSRMSTETQVAVLFADVVGSTRLYEVLGDHAARDMIVACVQVMRDATERNRGSVIKTQSLTLTP